MVPLVSYVSDRFFIADINHRVCFGLTQSKTVSANQAFPLPWLRFPIPDDHLDDLTSWSGDQPFVIRFRGPKPDPLASLSARISIVEIIGHEPYGASAGMLQSVWKIARVRHMVVPQIEPDNSRSTTRSQPTKTSCAPRSQKTILFLLGNLQVLLHHILSIDELPKIYHRILRNEVTGRSATPRLRILLLRHPKILLCPLSRTAQCLRSLESQVRRRSHAASGHDAVSSLFTPSVRRIVVHHDQVRGRIRRPVEPGLCLYGSASQFHGVSMLAR